MVRNVADIYQSGQYSIEAQKVKRAQGALNILSNSGRQGQRDMLHISYSERTYSKERKAEFQMRDWFDLNTMLEM